MMNQPGVTQAAKTQIEAAWKELLQRDYDNLKKARDVTELLRDQSCCSSIAFGLSRYVQGRWGKLENKRCVLTVGGETCTVTSIAALSGSLVPAQERETYVQLLAQVAKDCGMEDRYPARVFRRYYVNPMLNLEREHYFELTLAVDMNEAAAWKFLLSMGEPPCQYRRAADCVYTLCQQVPSLHSCQSFRELLARLRALNSKEHEPAQQGQTQALKWDVQQLAAELRELPPGEAMELAAEQLQLRAPLMQNISQTARKSFQRLVVELMELFDVSNMKELAVAMWSQIWVQFSMRGLVTDDENHQEFGRILYYDFVPFKDLVDLPKTLTAKPLWRSRLQQLYDGKLAVEKRDLVFLNLQRWAWSGEPTGTLENMRDFLRQTNEILQHAGLDCLYFPNPYDRMMLLAVASDNPMDTLSDLFEAATSEKKLEQKQAEQSEKYWKNSKKQAEKRKKERKKQAAVV